MPHRVTNHPSRGRLGLAALLCVLLSGCGDDVSQLLRPEGPGNPQANELGEDAQAFLLAIGALAGVTEFQKLHDFRTPTPLRLIGLRDNVWTFGFGANGACTTAASNTNDADQNGLLDDAVLTFTAQTCTLNLNGVPGPVTGSMRVQDLGGLFGLRLTYSNVRITFTVGDSTDVISLDGEAEVDIAATEATTTNRVTTRIIGTTPAGSVTLTFANDLTTRFTPTGTITTAATLPPGSFSFEGTMAFTAQGTGTGQLPAGLGSGTYTVEVSTPVALGYNGQCPPSSNFFNGGTVHMEIRGVAGAVVDADWGPCTATGPQPKR